MIEKRKDENLDIRRFKSLLQKLLGATNKLFTGPNRICSTFAGVLEGTFRREYVTALTILKLSEDEESPYGENCMALVRRLIESMVGIEYMLLKGKNKEAEKFAAFKDVEAKRDLKYLRSVDQLPSKEAQRIIEENYIKAQEGHLKSRKKLLEEHSWAGKRTEEMIKDLHDAGRFTDLEESSFVHIYGNTSGRVHFSPSGVLEYLYEELFVYFNSHNLKLSLFLTASAMSKLAMRFVEEIEVDDATRRTVTEIWQEVSRTKPSEVEEIIEKGGETTMPKCPKCRSENVEKTGVSHDTGVGDPEGNIVWSQKQSGYKCKNCGEHFSAPALGADDGK